VERTELERFKQLLDERHYLGSLKAVGERLHYVATDAQGQWLALLVFSAPANAGPYRKVESAAGKPMTTFQAA
jgi:hypothetical protein